MPERGATYSVGLRRWVIRQIAAIPLGRRPLNRGCERPAFSGRATHCHTRACVLGAGAVPRLSSGVAPAVSAEPANHGVVPLLDGVVLRLMIVALCAAAVAVLMAIAKGTVTLNENSGKWVFSPFTWRFAWLLRFVGITSVLSAGLLACLQGGIGWLGRRTQFISGIYFVSAFIWFLVGFMSFAKRDLVTESSSPLVWFICLGVTAGTRTVISRYLGKIAGIAAWLLFPLMLYSLSKIPTYGRFERVNPQVMYLSLLLWFACYHLLSTPGAAWLPKAARSIPLMACCVVAVFNQGRGWIIQCVLTLLLLLVRPLFLREVNAVSKSLKNGILAAMAVLAVFILLIQLQPLAIQGLIARGGEDTRTDQYEQFFSQVGLLKLVIGSGPNGSYAFEGYSTNYDSFDNQYIWMLLKGGFAIALGYIVLVIVPAFRLFFRARNESDYAAAATLILWSLALAGLSTYNSIGFLAQNYFIVLLAGYCHQRLAAQVHLPRIPMRGLSMLLQPQMRRRVSPTAAPA